MRHLLALVRSHLLLSFCLLLVSLILIVGSSLVLVRAQTPGVKAPSCGSLTLHEGVQNTYVLSPGARLSESCFVLAYQHCQLKALNVTWMGIDAGTTSTFTIEKQDKACQITQSSQEYVIGRSNANPDISTCQGLDQNTTTLLLKHCGGGDDILIPRAESCGVVYQQQTPDNIKQAEACFVQDYQQCYGSELAYEPSGILGYSFRLDFTCKLTVLVSTSQTMYACTGLTQQTDGLHALNCGTEGTIVIPSV